MMYCPQCKQESLTLYMGGQFGKYSCKKCGYIGPLAVEKSEEKIEKEEREEPKSQANKANRKKPLFIGFGTAIALFFLFGIPTAMIPNPFFTRMTPVSWFDWLILILTSLLAGVYIGLYYYKKQKSEKGICAATGGSFMGVFSYGCAICNKLLMGVLGFTAVATYIIPIQPYIGIVSIGLLSYGTYRLWQGG